jgi:hypothetical protein
MLSLKRAIASVSISGESEKREELSETKLVEILNAGSTSVVAARLLSRLLEDKLAFSPEGGYEFRGHGWRKVDFPSVRKYIVTRAPLLVAEVYDVIDGTIREDGGEVGALYSKVTWSTAKSNAGEIFESLRLKSVYVDRVFAHVKDILYDPRFEENKNTKDVVAYPDGVYDVGAGVFRSGLPGDVCTYAFSVPYATKANEEDTRLLLSYLGKIFRDGSILDFFLDFASTCLEPKNKDKILCIFRGCGNGGKTFVCNLLSSLFGLYCTRIPVAALSGKRAGGGKATPDIAVMDGTLLAITQEPSENEKLNLGLVKELTGNESSIYVRKLYGDGKQMQVRCKLIISMNFVNIATDLDKASEDRIKVIPFRSRFVSDESEVDEENSVFLADRNAERLIPRMTPPLLQILKERYASYRARGLVVPESVKRATEAFLSENEPLVQYLSKFKRNKLGVIHVSVLWEGYKSWYSENFPRSRPCNIKKFHEVLKRQGLKVSGDGANGFVSGLVPPSER